jgi:hypothetical protein
MYTSSKATNYHQDIKHVRNLTTNVDIGDISKNFASWWAATLVPGKAIVSQQDDGEYLAPWSISCEETHYFSIKWRRNVSAPEGLTILLLYRPERPSSFLLFLFWLYNLSSQFLVARPGHGIIFRFEFNDRRVTYF